MAELNSAANIAKEHTAGSSKNRCEFSARPQRKTADIFGGRPPKRPVENIEETHLTGYLCSSHDAKADWSSLNAQNAQHWACFLILARSHRQAVTLLL